MRKILIAGLAVLFSSSAFAWSDFGQGVQPQQMHSHKASQRPNTNIDQAKKIQKKDVLLYEQFKYSRTISGRVQAQPGRSERASFAR